MIQRHSNPPYGQRQIDLILNYKELNWWQLAHWIKCTFDIGYHRSVNTNFMTAKISRPRRIVFFILFLILLVQNVISIINPHFPINIYGTHLVNKMCCLGNIEIYSHLVLNLGFSFTHHMISKKVHFAKCIFIICISLSLR